MRKLSREFVTVAEEVHFLYPENQWALRRYSKEPRHKFFKKFGESMPKGDWNHPGTKQGVYMIGPNAEYLEGGGAISGSAPKVRKRLERALERWNKLRKQKKYANKSVPVVSHPAPPEVMDKPLRFRVFLRDLPRRSGDKSGRRFTKKDLRGMWLDFTKWAWNTNWLAFDDPKAFVPKGAKEMPIAEGVALRICRQVLVDNVRGQTPAWKAEHVKDAALTMQRVKVQGGKWQIEYRGRAQMDSGRQKYAPTIYGRGTWNAKSKRFEALTLLAVGMRAGKGTFNQRGRDQGPAPMGVVLKLHQ